MQLFFFFSSFLSAPFLQRAATWVLCTFTLCFYSAKMAVSVAKEEIDYTIKPEAGVNNINTADWPLLLKNYDKRMSNWSFFFPIRKSFLCLQFFSRVTVVADHRVLFQQFWCELAISRRFLLVARLSSVTWSPTSTPVSSTWTSLPTHPVMRLLRGWRGSWGKFLFLLPVVLYL